MIELIKAIILGIVEGITEWLPISSTGHMILFNSFFPMKISMDDPAFWNLFLVVIQLGAILAVCVLYFHKLNPFSPKKNKEEKRHTIDLWLHVAVASLPAAVIGLLFNDMIEEKFQTPIVVAMMLIIYGVLFIIVEKMSKKTSISQMGQLSYKTALYIGAFQVLALIPGTSRSGATILGAILLGCSRVVASEFSFFCAIPVMLGASGLKVLKYIMKHGFSVGLENIAILLIAMIVAFVVSVIAIRFLMGYIKKHDFKIFGYYRIAIGVIILFCVFGLGLQLSA